MTLTNEVQTDIISNLTLPAFGEYGSTITWTSDNPAISNTGIVTRGKSNTLTSLTATITYEDASDTVSFTLTVTALPDTDTQDENPPHDDTPTLPPYLPTYPETSPEPEQDDTSVPELWNNPFSDVDSSAWYYGDVAYVQQKGLMSGTAADKFSPTLFMTRAMLVTILYRHAGEPDASAWSNPFDDVKSGTWYTDAVKWAVGNGIVTGIGADRYNPDTNITRQELAVILMRYIDFAGVEYAVTQEYRIFTDENEIADYAKNSIQTLNKLGIINGVGGDNISPKGSATRAQVAAMLHRFAELAV